MVTHLRRALKSAHVMSSQMLSANGTESMSNLEEDLPHLAFSIRAALPGNAPLSEAYDDYQFACKNQNSPDISDAERAEWTRIRHEVADELVRLCQRDKEPK